LASLNDSNGRTFDCNIKVCIFLRAISNG
jgi:hypothetical protein